MTTGDEKNPGEALRWYRKAADQGDGRAMRAIGQCYETGIGTGKDIATAVQWYEKAIATP